MLNIPGFSHNVDGGVHKNERGCSRVYGARRVSRYQDIVYSYFHHYGEMLMIMGDVDLGLRPSPFPPIIQVS